MRDRISEILHGPPKIRIGKRGLTETIVTEVQKILKKDGAIKIKCLKSVPKDVIPLIAENIAELTGGKVVDIRGKTFVISKKV